MAWYVFAEPSGAFRGAAKRCSQLAGGRFTLVLKPLPTDADQQREQLVRRLAAADPDIDIIGMDVIWTAEFAEAGWILPWPAASSKRVSMERLSAAVESARYKNRLWAAPFTSNAQLLWYRSDRVKSPPRIWHELIEKAETFGSPGTLQLQGQRYEGLTVFFISLLASAGGSVLDESGSGVALEEAPTVEVLSLMKKIASSPAADRALATAREDQARLAFETGEPTFMVNYPFVWSSSRQNAPKVAAHMAFARWPSINRHHLSRIAIGGLNLGVNASARHPGLAFEAAECLASKANQVIAAKQGGLPPTLETLYDDPEVRQRFPFADSLRETLREAVLRPRTPVYNDVSLAISRTLHPMRDIDPVTDAKRLRKAVARALNSEGLL
ncbi:ABC transporter substrate-binding protein [Candidatus Methylobacter favarea]|uniref:ABC transporter substrate-binding protein n=1 Tax=Candidatus Methylobacter favarea TaxID=2707345 RepID=UPI001FEA005C|nr:ABC transporter substrate-binding protein [Candidatus Methylobacter favarea]